MQKTWRCSRIWMSHSQGQGAVIMWRDTAPPPPLPKREYTCTVRLKSFTICTNPPCRGAPRASLHARLNRSQHKKSP